ncbi:MAG TPA: penicillin-binding protein 2 [Myxococcales bacterium]|nr:penicillin-binding protein 2 [Myxococcales bacterium]
MPSMLGLVRRDADEIRELRPRTALGALVVVCAMLVLIVRLYQLQILRGDEYTAQSVSNFRKSLFVPADRGMIKDRNGRILVDNRPSFDVFLTPAFCPPQVKVDARDKSGAAADKTGTRDDVIAKLATYLSMTPEDIDRMRQDYQRSWTSRDKLEKFKPYLVELDIPRDQVDVLEAHRSELSCVDLIPTPHRNYRIGPSLGHILGYMSEVTPEELDDKPDDYRRGQTIGRRGVERRWEKELGGSDGRENIAVNARGQHLGKEMDELLIPENERFIAATPGNNLILSLDERLQEAADSAFPGRAGAVLVMEAKTGFILALLSRPSFDPNKMSGRITRAELQKINEDSLKPMLNRVMNENYHPGSTFKVVASLAGLEEGEITPNSTLFCTGGYTMGNHRWRCDKPTGHGPLTVRTALQVSCDAFYYALGDRVGLDAISGMAHRLGYGQPTGLDLGREITGIIPESKTVNPATGSVRSHAINAAIGQGEVNVTPLQQAVAYAAIANGGTVWTPQIVRRIETPEGKVVREFQPLPDVNNGREGKLDVKPQNLAVVREGLVAVVNELGGTAYRSRLKDVEFGGKTGTAQVMKLGQKQKLDPATQAYLSRDHAWFVAFAPADDPEIVVVVLNEHGGWGADAAAPTASKVVRAYFELKKQDAVAMKAGP